MWIKPLQNYSSAQELVNIRNRVRLRIIGHDESYVNIIGTFVKGNYITYK